MSISSPDKKKVTTDSAVSLRMTSTTMISTAPSFPTIITPRNAIAADFIRIVFNDCQWRNDYGPMIKLLLVCKEWFYLAMSLLWRKATINSEAAAEKFLQTISSERGHLYKRYLRALDVFGLPTADPIEPWFRSVCTCLETGAPFFSDLDGCFYVRPSFVDAIGPNLRRQLEGLTIGSLRGEHFQLFPNLKRLDSDTEYTDPSIFRDFVAFAPQLTRISVSLRPEYGPLSVRVLESLINIKDLEIIFDSDVETPAEHLLDNVFRRALEDPSRVFLPKLTSLKLALPFFWWSDETLIAFFRRIRETLIKVDLESDSECSAALRVLSYTGDRQNRKNYVLRELIGLPYKPEEWEELNFDNFKVLESIEISNLVDQTRIPNSCGKTLLRLSFRVVVRDRAHTRESGNFTSIMKRFLDGCPHLEELTLVILGDTVRNLPFEWVFDGVAHFKLLVLRVIDYYRMVSSEDKKRMMMTKVWSQCPNLYNIFWNGVCYGRHHQ